MGYVRGCNDMNPQNHVPPNAEDVETAMVIAVSFRSMRSSQLPVGGEPRTPLQQRPLLTIDEAATYLNVPARWVADAVRQRKVRCTRIGKHIRFRIERGHGRGDRDGPSGSRCLGIPEVVITPRVFRTQLPG